MNEEKKMREKTDLHIGEGKGDKTRRLVENKTIYKKKGREGEKKQRKYI